MSDERPASRQQNAGRDQTKNGERRMATTATDGTVMMPWRPFLARLSIVGAALSVFVGGAAFVGVKLASADPGGPVSPEALTFAGVLRERAMRSTTLTFAFRRGGATICTMTTMPFTPDTNGAFSVQVPMDPMRCPRQLFDGASVTYNVVLDGETTPILSDVAITPIPYARFADQAGVNNECPAGYVLLTGSSTTGRTICGRTIAGGIDEVVKVGNGASAFWVDRYEATAFDRTGTRSDAYAGLNANGQWTTAVARESLLALSRPGVAPSSNVTWFQAAALCNAAGKRLMTRREWFAAADGLTTVEMGSNNCNVSSSSARVTAMGTSCASSWGAEDMIGNLWEWTDEWYAGVGQTTTVNGSSPISPATSATRNAWLSGVVVNGQRPVWGAAFGNDTTHNVTSSVYNASDNSIGVPAAAARGGTFTNGEENGVFTLSLTFGPAFVNASVGFRCVVPR